MTSAPAGSATPALIPPNLVAVLQELREKGLGKPLRANVGGLLRKKHPKLYPGFGSYVMEAEKLGIVELGIGATLGSEWIQLMVKASPPPLACTLSSAPHTPLTLRSSPSLHRPRSRSSPPAFISLVNILRTHLAAEVSRPLCSKVGEQLKQGFPSIYQESGIAGFKVYATRAKELGIVELGGPAAGAEWIALTARVWRV